MLLRFTLFCVEIVRKLAQTVLAAVFKPNLTPPRMKFSRAFALLPLCLLLALLNPLDNTVQSTAAAPAPQFNNGNQVRSGT